MEFTYTTRIPMYVVRDPWPVQYLLTLTDNDGNSMDCYLDFDTSSGDAWAPSIHIIGVTRHFCRALSYPRIDQPRNAHEYAFNVVKRHVHDEWWNIVNKVPLFDSGEPRRALKRFGGNG